MKIYWSDREGKSPPLRATFHTQSFSAKEGNTFKAEFVELPDPISIRVVKKTYFPTYKNWEKGVEKALKLIRNKELEKVVLCRTCTLELEKEPDPFAIASALKQKAEGAFIFCLQSGSESFLGATPERLFLRHGDQIISEAVAGTRRRGQTSEEDQKLQKELLSSKKDLQEINPVQTYLQEVLSPFCLSPPLLTPISIHQTHNVQHLYSLCSGKLKGGVTDEKILSALHPTPALCGSPKQKAYSLIKELEPFERGLYGGVIGWSTPESSEWIVGIRSCLIQGKTATLFSGTGIVEGSDPKKEWDELNQKLKIYKEIFLYNNF